MIRISVRHIALPSILRNRFIRFKHITADDLSEVDDVL